MYSLTIPVICAVAYKYKEETLRELKRCKADRVAIALRRELKYKFSSEENMNMLAELIPYFKNHGLEVMVWIGETIGHDRYFTPVTDYGYTNIRTPEGHDVSAFCPMDRHFTDDIAGWIKRVAACAPDIILLDDDFRMGDSFGCCCELHMERIRRELDEDISVSELSSKILSGGASKYRSTYLKVQGDGLINMAKKIRQAVDEVDSSIRIGACITNDRWDTNGIGPVEISKILAGGNRPFIRLFGAPYHVCITSLASAIDKERTQLDRLKGLDIEVIAEGDTYPRPRFACPAAYLECFDMILRADGASDGIMKYMLDYSASPSYETGYTDAHCRNEELYREISELFDGGSCFGFTPYLPLDKLEYSELDYYGNGSYRELSEQTFEYDTAYELLSASSLPTSYEDGSVKIVFGESARKITDGELKCGAVIDIEAARILFERGIDVGLAEPINNAGYRQETFNDVPYEYFISLDETVRLDPSPSYDLKLKPTARVLTKLVRGDTERDFVYRYDSEAGHKFLVLPFNAKDCKKKMGYFKNYHRKKQLIDAFLEMQGAPVDAYVESNHPMLYMLGKNDGGRLKIGLWNLYDDKIHSVRLKINRTFADVKFVNCTGHTDADTVIIDSVLYPFEFAGVCVE